MRTRLRSPEWLFLFSGVAFDGVMWGWYLAAIVWWVEDLAFSPLELMLLGTVLLVVQQISEVPTGVVADRFSRKWSIVLGFLIMGAAVILSVVSTNFVVILLAQGLAGFGWTFRSGADIAWVTAELPGADISRLIVRRHRLHLVVGGISIPFVMVVGSWSLRGVMAMIGAFVVAGGFVLAAFMPDSKRELEADEPELTVVEIFRHGVRTVRTSRSLTLLALLALLTGAAAETIDRLGFKRFLDEGDFGDDSLLFTGLVFLTLVVSGLIVIGVVERVIDRGWSYQSVAFAMLVLATIGAVTIAIAPVIVVAVGLFLQDGNREALAPVTESWTNEIAEESSRATVHSLMSLTIGLGESVGGLGLAVVAEVWSIEASLLGAAAALALAAALCRLTTTEERVIPAG